MKKVIFFMLALVAVSFGGGDQRNLLAYIKYCKMCHGPAYKGAAMKTTDEWDKLFKNDAEGLKALHTKVPESKEVFEDRHFNNAAKRMMNFLKANSLDSGAVRSCDGINCG